MRLQFSNIDIDTETYVLKRDGKTVAIEPLVFELLILLASNPDVLFSKDELIATIWAGRVVSDTTVSSAIKNARKAVGDNGKQQSLIKTVHGRGFRFVGNIEQHRPAEHADNEPITLPNDTAPCLLVMPFKPLTNDTRVVFSADSIHLELERIFSRIPLLRISAEASRYRHLELMPSPRQIHDQTSASYLVEGLYTVTKTSLQLSAQLTDTKGGVRIWSEKISRPLPKSTTSPGQQFDNSGPESIVLEDLVLEGIVLELVRRLEPQIAQSIYRHVVNTDGDRSPRALYLHASGLLALKGWHADTFTEAAALLRDSLRLEKDFGLAAAYLALLMAFGHRIGLLSERGSAVKESLAMAEHALAVSAADSTVLGFAGCAFCDLNEQERGIPLLKKAIDINPANGQAWVALGGAYLSQGDIAQALEHLAHGVAISPLDTRLAVWRSLLAIAYLLDKKPNEARAQAEQACADDDQTYMPRVVLAAARLLLQDKQGAARALTDAYRVKPDLSSPEIDALIGAQLRDRLLALPPTR